MNIKILVFLHELGHAIDDYSQYDKLESEQDIQEAEEAFANAFPFFFVMLFYQAGLEFKDLKKSRIPLGLKQAFEYKNKSKPVSYRFFILILGLFKGPRNLKNF